jgi:seryl-tRNA synthetase
MQDLILVLSFGNVIFWILLGIFQRQKIEGLEKEVTDLNLHIKYLDHKHDELEKELDDFKEEFGYIPTGKVYIHSEYAVEMKLKKPAQFKQIIEIFDILKEAGIIIKPPTNISVPDPRGYSVKKVK